MRSAEVVVPGRLQRLEIADGVERAAARLRTEIASGGIVLLVDETASISETLRKQIEEFGLAVVSEWRRDFVADPAEVATSLSQRVTNPLEQLIARHVSNSLVRMSTAARRIILVLNPADESPAVSQAAQLGADVYALPKRRTALPAVDAEVVPWRRASDLNPILMATKPPDFEIWRREYRKFASVHAKTSDVLVRRTRNIESPLMRAVRVAQGGRMILSTFSEGEDAPDILEFMKRLGIWVTQLHDSDEWVVGGTSVGAMRALQVTRTPSRSQFDVQLVWGGPDPSPSQLLAFEEEVRRAASGNVE